MSPRRGRRRARLDEELVLFLIICGLFGALVLGYWLLFRSAP